MIDTFTITAFGGGMFVVGVGMSTFMLIRSLKKAALKYERLYECFSRLAYGLAEISDGYDDDGVKIDDLQSHAKSVLLKTLPPQHEDGWKKCD